jgi:hypothetical protein
VLIRSGRSSFSTITTNLVNPVGKIGKNRDGRNALSGTNKPDARKPASHQGFQPSPKIRPLN